MKHAPAGLLTFLAIVPLALQTGIAQQATPAEVRLKAAINKEVVDGDLKAAIEQYREIAKGGNRAVAAKALVRMGRCYEKLGDLEARKAYEQVLREFGDQAESAAEARARLAALSVSVARTSARVDRRVWAGPDVGVDGKVTPDGRFLSYTDWDTGDLAVHDFVTGDNRRITSKGTWATSSECTDVSIVSPDGRQIAYNWYNESGYYDFRIVAVDGGKPRVLVSDREHVAYITPWDWSPDGRQVLASFMKPDETFEVRLVSVSDGSTRTVKTTGKEPPPYARFSPDGRYLASGGQGRIVLLDLQAGGESPLVEDAARQHVLGWAPDGRHLFFSGDRSGSMDAWLLPVADGKAAGQPILVRQDFNPNPLGFVRSGAFYYSVRHVVWDVQTTDLDPASGRVQSPPAAASRRWAGITRSPDWSPDGRFLAYVKDRQQQPNQSIVVNEIDTGEEREIRVASMTILLGLRWSRDGKSIVVPVFEQKQGMSLVRLDVQTGAITPVMPLPRTEGSFPRFDFSPDGRTVYYVKASATTDASHARLIARDLESGRETELLVRRALYSVSVAPDGRRLAVGALGDAKAQVVLVMPAGGGDTRQIIAIEAEQANYRVPAAWTPDGRHIVFVRGQKGRPTRNVQVWRVPAEGGEPERLGLTVDELWWLRMHPDGRRVALGTWRTEFEVWVMENFLPAGK